LAASAEAYLARAERAAFGDPASSAVVTVPSIARIGVIGAGTMGGGIAMNFLNRGARVCLVDTTQAALEAGITRIRANYQRSVARGKLTAADLEQRMALLQPGVSIANIVDCDLVIEAVYEDLDIKRTVFGQIDRFAKPGAILATNTSHLDVNAIASATQRPEHVVGLHFFSPANVMKLIEVVRAAHTSDGVIASVLAMAQSIGKIPVVVGVCHGFVANRMSFARRAQAMALIQEGAMPWDVDRVLEEFGMPMGPFAMTDLAGLDIGWSADKSQGSTDLKHRLCELGRVGQKAGAGYYNYDPETRERSVDQGVRELVEEYARRSARGLREISDAEILERCLYAVVNEGAKILGERIARCASDIDLVWVNGYGWPRWRGGPMFWADSIGLAGVLDKVQFYASQHGSDWAPAPLLMELAARGMRLTGWRGNEECALPTFPLPESARARVERP